MGVLVVVLVNFKKNFIESKKRLNFSFDKTKKNVGLHGNFKVLMIWTPE